jgi:hypothetical protein
LNSKIRQLQGKAADADAHEYQGTIQGRFVDRHVPAFAWSYEASCGVAAKRAFMSGKLTWYLRPFSLGSVPSDVEKWMKPGPWKKLPGRSVTMSAWDTIHFRSLLFS